MFACTFRVDGVRPGGSVVGPDLGLPAVGDGSGDGGAPDMARAVAHPILSVVSSGGVGGNSVDLTALGTLDWVHWGSSSGTDADRKANGGQISDLLELINTSTKPFSGNATSFSWRDGRSDGGHQPSSNGTSTGIYTNGGGYTLSVPAGLAPRRLIVYVALNNAQARMQVSLSDGSAMAYEDSKWQRGDDTTLDVVYTIVYAAASDGQRLTLSWSQLASEVPFLGTPAAVGIAAAALTQ